MLIGGDADRVTHPGLQRELAAGIPGARQVGLPGQGHLAVNEATAAHFRHVLGFFAAVEAAGGAAR